MTTPEQQKRTDHETLLWAIDHGASLDSVFRDLAAARADTDPDGPPPPVQADPQESP